MIKIYTDDPLVSYAHSTIGPDRTKLQIDSLLREYNVADITWHWKPEIYDVWVGFVLEENIDGFHARVAVKVVCPILWDKAQKRPRDPSRAKDNPNLQVSMRVMYHYIKTHLESAYAMQSSRVAGFLPDIVTQKGSRFFDDIKGNLDKYTALPDQREKTQREVEVILPKPKNVTNEM